VIALLLFSKIAHDIFNFQVPLSFGDPSQTTVWQVITAVVWLSASYLAGHITAFAASYLIEKFVHNHLGYPSDIWLKSEELPSKGKPRRLVFRKIFSRNLQQAPDQYWVPRLINLLQLPAAIPILVLGWLKPFGFYTPKIPFGLLPLVKHRFEALGTKVPLEQGSRWEKIVEHYVASHCIPAYTRLYNYLVIYGVLRTLGVLILAYLWYFLTRDVMLKVANGCAFDLKRTLFFHGCTASYVLCLMAFAKFNRRFFEESIYAFLLACAPPKSIVAVAVPGTQY
jgi:hypothetical protein